MESGEKNAIGGSECGDTVLVQVNSWQRGGHNGSGLVARGWLESYRGGLKWQWH